MTGTATPSEIFCSYAYEDEEWQHRLETHLSMLKREGLISIWHNRLVAPGTNWAKAIDNHLETASVILLLISADFLASDYCYGIEMKRALERHSSNKAVVVPILVREVDWTNAPFAHLQVLPSNARSLALWPDPDQVLKDVSVSLRGIIEALPQFTQNMPPVALPPIWMIPFARNPFFIGRDEVLTQLHQQLQTWRPLALSQPQAISGLGGIGKTQVAVEYAYRYHQDYQAVFWVSAQSQETLISSYVNIAEKLGLPTLDAEDQQIIVQVIKTWLERQRNWLLIIDNADELAWLPTFLPTALGGHLLITTRATAMGRLAQRLEVATFAPEQGALFLMRRAARIAPDAVLEQVDSDERDMALRISSELGGLALALDQAGAYIEETGCGLIEYWRIYQQHHTKLLNERRGLVADHPEPVASTWAIAFARVKEQNPAAVELLQLCAFLAPDDIPEELLSKGIQRLKPELARVVIDSFLLNEAIEILRAYSLIDREPKIRSLSVHRLVQTVLRAALPSIEYQQWIAYVVSLLNEAFPIVEFANWSLCERYLPHVLLCANWIEQSRINIPEAASLLNRTARYLHDRARYSVAEPLYNQALVISERILGDEHPGTAEIINNLGLLYYNQGKYEEAERLLKQDLIIRAKVLGDDDLYTADTINNLAGLYRRQGKYKKSENLYRRSLIIREKVLEDEHPYIAHSLNNLGLLYKDLRKYEEAESLLRRALAISEKVLGNEHLNTAMSLNNLGELYRLQRKYEEAELLLKRGLAIYELILGNEHPSTAMSLNNLALLYHSQGNYEKTEGFYKQALAIYMRAFGSNHPNTIIVRNNYEQFLGSQRTQEVWPSDGYGYGYGGGGIDGDDAEDDADDAGTPTP